MVQPVEVIIPDKIARADVVGSLLRPEYLIKAKERMREGEIDHAELHRLEDQAVVEAIALQEKAKLELVGRLVRKVWGDQATGNG